MKQSAIDYIIKKLRDYLENPEDGETLEVIHKISEEDQMTLEAAIKLLSSIPDNEKVVVFACRDVFFFDIDSESNHKLIKEITFQEYWDIQADAESPSPEFPNIVFAYD